MHSMRITIALISVMLLVGLAACAEDANILKNADFSAGMDLWEPYGNDKALIRAEKEGIAVPVGHASIAQVMDLEPKTCYRLTIVYRRSARSTSCGLVFFFNRPGGINASAGVINVSFPREDAPPGDGKWETFNEIIRTPAGTGAGKVVLSARGTGAVTYAKVTLAKAESGLYRGNIVSADWSVLSRTRTKAPMFKQRLSDKPGGYRVVAWAHNLNRKNLPPALLDKYPEDKWPEEVERMYKESGEVGLGYYNLPWQGDKADDLYNRFGVTFDVMCESSGVKANAVKAGGEVLNPTASSKTSADPSVSLVDPVYISTAVDELKTHAERFKGKPYVFVYIGKDEPSVQMPEGPVESWGPFWKSAAEEVRRRYYYDIPARDDPGYISDEKNRPLRWIAYNRWMADKYCASKIAMYEALKSVDPKARYNPCDYWFMTGFTPFNFEQMARWSDLVECDPYASSAERIPGRGLYNHSFGPKFLSDLTGKPVRSIVQAFDYAGYEMTPEDLREWVSQSLRGGASHISYYQMDNPRFNDPERWAMMLHLSKVITTMNAIERPTDADVAVYYSSASHRAEGASTKANEIYTAHSILGERLGSWFDFIGDEGVTRGNKYLDRYRAVYIPLGAYDTMFPPVFLEQYVERGGTLISGDPAVFSWYIDGQDLASEREKIFGVRTIKPVNRTSLTITDTCGIPGLKVGETLPIYRPVGRDGWTEDNGWLIETTRPDVEVLATFTDGTPAITMAKYGKGRAIYFAANPFVPECLLGGGEWEAFFRALQKSVGAKTDRPIWRFKLPAPGD